MNLIKSLHFNSRIQELLGRKEQIKQCHEETLRHSECGNYRDGRYVKSPAYSSVSHRLPTYVMGYSAPMFSPTGGVKISPNHLAQYMMMHMNYGELNGVRIISEQSAREMQTPVWYIQNMHEWEEQYGLCLHEFVDFIDDEQYNQPGHYPVGHTGDAYGLRSVMIWSPADGWGIVAMTNGYVYNHEKDIVKAMANSIYKAAIAN